MSNKKENKSILLAARVTPDFVSRFDRVMTATQAIGERSTVLRHLAEQWVEQHEREMAGTYDAATAQQ